MKAADIDCIADAVVEKLTPVIAAELACLTGAVLRPINLALADVQESCRQLVRGQAYLESFIGERGGDEGEEWRNPDNHEG